MAKKLPPTSPSPVSLPIARQTVTPPLLLPHKDLVTLILRDQGIHEGIWMLALNFAFTAMNAGIDDTNIHPAALASVIGIGIAKTDKLNSLSVDAAIANPAPTTMRKPRVKKLSYG